jgi:hypothetical protein
MSKVSKLSKMLSEQLGDIQLIRGVMIIKPSSHVVRGFLFDRCSEKDKFYLYRIIIPLFSPVMPNFSLNYSERIFPHTVGPMSALVASCGCEDVEKIVKRLMREKETLIRDMSTPKDFAERFTEENSFRINIKLELAIAYALAGKSETAEAMAREVLHSPTYEKPFFEEVQMETNRCLNSLQAGFGGTS